MEANNALERTASLLRRSYAPCRSALLRKTSTTFPAGRSAIVASMRTNRAVTPPAAEPPSAPAEEDKDNPYN